MKKDVIYVDIEDDITSVIAKVKGAKAPIVALVPPKRIGVLQSTVNLKLLQKAAKTADKTLVLITSDHALSGLAAGVAIPVAKNLQSKPELAPVAKPEADEDDVINGAELPVGDLAATAPGAAAAAKEESIIDNLPDFDKPLAARAASKAPKKSSGSKIPNFDDFRKKIFLAAGAGVLLIAFFVWAIFFAPSATVSITAKTNVVNIDKNLQLKPGAQLDTAQNVAPAIVKQVKKTASVDFQATGKKEVGEKATGTVRFSKQSQTSSVVPAGTQVVSSSGLVFLTDSSVTIPPSDRDSPGCFPTACAGTATVGVTASAPGSKFNGASGTVSGSFGGASASFTSSTSGGTDKTATVVSQGDVDKAKEQLKSQDSSAVKSELAKQFTGDSILIQESFLVTPADPSSTPAVGQEASTAKLTAETTYTMVAVSRADLKKIFDAYTKTQIDKNDNQKIYESGDKKVAFSEFSAGEGGAYTTKVRAAAQVGPEIDDGSLAKTLVGKRAGEIQQQLEGIQGVEDVETKLSPFWVTTAPKAERITIKFLIKNE